MSDGPLTLTKVAEQLRSPVGRQEMEKAAAWDKMQGMTDEEFVAFEKDFNEKRAEAEKVKTAEECEAAGDLIGSGFLARIAKKEGMVDLQTVSDFCKAAEAEGVSMPDLVKMIIKSAKLADAVDEAANKQPAAA